MVSLTSALLSHTHVVAAHVLSRSATDGAPRTVAYIVLQGAPLLESLGNHVRKLAPSEPLPDAWVPLTRMPLDAHGNVDVEALCRLPVVEPGHEGAWARLLASQADIGRVAVLPTMERSDASRVHLDALLPGRSLATGPDRAPTHATQGPILAREGALALCDGGPLPPDPDAPTVLTEAFLRTARMHRESGLLLVDASGAERIVSYAALAEQSLCLLADLQARGLRPGDRAILQFRDPARHFRAFWACVLGGIIPVTVAVPPTYEPQHAVVRKLVNVWHLLEQPPVFTEPSLEGAVASVLDREAQMPARLVVVDEVPPCLAGKIHPAKPGDVIFLQLTSGSTGTPKCIQETHAGIIAHLRASTLFNDYGPRDVTLNWLPFDHVVPILTYHLKDVYLGCRQIHVQTDRILGDPLEWLRLLDRHRVTRTWAPNFAFKMVADDRSKRPGARFDLSSIRSFMNAGEMVTLPALREFSAALEPLGLAPEAIQPSFGMAEACTCMTYNSTFDLQRSAVFAAKSSLQGDLRACGANFYAFEVKDVVNRVEGVASMWSAACSWSDPEGATEGLAIFFVAKTTHDEAAVVRRIRTEVAAALGIAPSIIVPLSPSEFPKTTSGKIQRTQLKGRLANDGWRTALAHTECLLGSERTLPDWFFRPTWQPAVTSLVEGLAPGAPDLPLLLVTHGGLPVSPQDEMVPEHSLARALATVGSEEVKGLFCRHLDLAAGDPGWVEWVLGELRDARHEYVVALRQGRRLVPRLRRERPEPHSSEPLRRGGRYLLSGGLGGLGLALAKHLSAELGAHLLILGRAPHEERSAAIAVLTQIGARFTYVSLDVAQGEGLAGAARAFEDKAGGPLDGIFHLAGVYEPRLLRDQSADDFDAALRAKVDGATALARLLDDRPACALYAFSSINAHFGGLMVAAYTAANLELESLVHRLGARGRRAVALAWSTWDGLGMNANSVTRERLAILGYRAIDPLQGWLSTLAVLAGGVDPNGTSSGVWLIGLDPGRARIQRELEGPSEPAAPLTAYFESSLDVFPWERLASLRVTDAFGTAIPCTFRHLPRLPLDARGDVDAKALERLLKGAPLPRNAKPTTDVERYLVEIWRQALGIERLGVHDKFLRGGRQFALDVPRPGADRGAIRAGNQQRGHVPPSQHSRARPAPRTDSPFALTPRIVGGFGLPNSRGCRGGARVSVSS